MGHLRLLAFALVGVTVSFIAVSESCHAKGDGWGQEGILIPKPTLIPKLAAAFHDGKKAINRGVAKGKALFLHKLNLKPSGWSGGLSTKDAFNGLGWSDGVNTKNAFNGMGWKDYEYGYAVNSPYTGDFKNVFEKSIKGVGVKGGWSTHDKNSFKHLSYGYGDGWETPSLNGWGGWGWDTFSDYGRKK